MVYKNSKKGAQGIGTLIIFIALILVAAVAAGVLISTVGKLQGKAETTSTQIQQKLGTGFDVFQVTAENTNDSYINQTKDAFAVSLRLSPGSDPVKLNDVVITLVTKSGSYSYNYNTSSGTTLSTIKYSNKTFGSEYIQSPKLSGYISSSDTVTLWFNNSATSIGENEQFTIRLFPGKGNPIPVSLVTPPAMVTKVTVLK